MNFFVKKGDLFEQDVDAIVIPGQPSFALEGNIGTQAKKYCGDLLEEELKQLRPLSIGEAAIVNSYNLRAKRIIYTANPRHLKDGVREDEERRLAKTYENALELVNSFKLSSVAFPLLSAGAYEFSKRSAIEIAIASIQKYLTTHPNISVLLVIGNEDTWKSYGTLFNMPGITKMTGKIPPRSKEFIEAVRHEHLRLKWYDEDTLRLFDNKESLKLFKEKFEYYKKQNAKENTALIYEGIMSRTTFSKVMNDHSALTKDRIIAMGINMRLTNYEIDDLLECIGECFNQHSARDKIIMEDNNGYFRGTVESINDHLKAEGFLPLNTK